jgi:hypothetical protein
MPMPISRVDYSARMHIYTKNQPRTKNMGSCETGHGHPSCLSSIIGSFTLAIRDPHTLALG